LINFDENGFLISGKLIAGAVARSGTESSNPALSRREFRSELSKAAREFT